MPFISLRISCIVVAIPEVDVLSWWGNVGVFETMDAVGTAIRTTVADGETFEPEQVVTRLSFE
jgi:hypothetical protein